MPLDGNLASFVGPLDRLNITPLDPEMVATYRAAYLKGYVARHPLSTVEWKTMWFHRWKVNGIKSTPWRPFVDLTVADFLAKPVPYQPTNDHSAAPPALVRLATRIERAVPEAEFGVEYFDNDPILKVVINGHTDYLGIWEHGEIKAIAVQGVSEWRRWRPVRWWHIQ